MESFMVCWLFAVIKIFETFNYISTPQEFVFQQLAYFLEL